MSTANVDPARWIGKHLVRCMGGNRCTHLPGECTADPDYQAFIKWERERLQSPAPTTNEAATEIGHLVTRILALAPAAGLYVGIKIEPAATSPQGEGSQA